jgi:hypothetical protein
MVVTVCFGKPFLLAAWEERISFVFTKGYEAVAGLTFAE